MTNTSQQSATGEKISAVHIGLYIIQATAGMVNIFNRLAVDFWCIILAHKNFIFYQQIMSSVSIFLHPLCLLIGIK